LSADLRISGASPNSRSESDIRVNYQDASKIVAASNDLTASTQPQYYSTDGGVTWNQSSLSLVGSDVLHSDPAVDWTSDGTAWAITIGIGPGFSPLMLRSYRSTDFGATWSFEGTPSGAQTNVDREVMWVDHSTISPFKDQIYVTWHQGVPGFVSRRTAGAGGTWQAPVQVTGAETAGTAIGGDIKTNSVGDVFVFWPEDGGNRQIHVAKSTDGGASFGAPVTVASIFASQRQISIPADTTPKRMARVYVSGGAYRTASKDLVYAVWTDLSGEAGCTSGLGPGSSVASACKSRVWFARSTDGGATWSAPTKINNQAGKNDQFHSRLCVDETDGRLVVVYNDTIGDPGRLKTDIWMQHSEDDGVTWSSPVKVTSAQTDETVPAALWFGYGDYLGLSGHAGTYFPSWTDRRSGGVEEIWTAAIVLRKAVAPFQYAAKFVCGKPGGGELAPGVYFTAINVHNPTERGVRFRKKVAVAGRRERPGPVSRFFDAKLGPDEALEIDCPDIRRHAGVHEEFLKGFVVIESETELDVVAVYTAAGEDRQVETLHVERVPPRRAQAGLPDLIPLADPKTGFCKRDNKGNLIVTVKNQGSADAGASTTTVVFGPGGTFSKPTPPIAAGASVNLTFPIPAACFNPECSFRIIVDSGNQVTESNEGNNTASGTCLG
jgi:CARDB/BNR/Asp-box repeat